MLGIPNGKCNSRFSNLEKVIVYAYSLVTTDRKGNGRNHDMVEREET